MIAIPTECYPLAWPTGVPRTRYPQRATAFGRDHTVAAQLDEVERQLRLMKVSASVISSNLPPRRDGRPSSSTTRFSDQGVCVYWTSTALRGGERVKVPHAMPCDHWDLIEHNLRAVALSLEAMRGLTRWGAVTVEQAFAGFVALPPGDAAATAPVETPWREVLGVPTVGWVTEAPREVVLRYAKDLHRELIKAHHPDRGGDPAIAAAVNVALEQAERELTS